MRFSLSRDEIPVYRGEPANGPGISRSGISDNPPTSGRLWGDFSRFTPDFLGKTPDF